MGTDIDNVLSARIVISRDQQVSEASATQNEDLFWALRGGGGGNFGAVTRFTYQLRPIDPILLGGMLLYEWQHAKAMFQFYRDWMNGDNNDLLTLLPMFFIGPENKWTAGLSAFYNGDAQAGLSYVKKILAEAKMPDPLNGPVDQALVRGTLPAYTGTESTTAWPGSAQYWRSGFLQNDFPDEAVDTFLSWYEKCPLSPSRPSPQPQGGIGKQDDLSFGFIESLGGAIERVHRDQTAFFWRDQRFSFTFIGIYDSSDTEWGARTREWADASARRWSLTSRAVSTSITCRPGSPTGNAPITAITTRGCARSSRNTTPHTFSASRRICCRSNGRLRVPACTGPVLPLTVSAQRRGNRPTAGRRHKSKPGTTAWPISHS